MEPIKKRKETQGIFIGGSMQLGAFKPEYVIYGYIKAEDSHWVAVCVNVCLVAEGDSPTEAFERLIESATSYIQVLKRDYPKKWKSKLEYESPPEFLREFAQILSQLEPLFDSLPKHTPRRKTSQWTDIPTLRPNIIPGNIFVQPISASYTQ